jgi:hypothetical protein
MKFFGKSRATQLIEEYHPWVSILALVGIVLSKYYHHENFLALTDISYPTTIQRGTEEFEHYSKGTNDKLFVFFFFNVVTVARYFYRKLVLEVQIYLFVMLHLLILPSKAFNKEVGALKRANTQVH